MLFVKQCPVLRNICSVIRSREILAPADIAETKEIEYGTYGILVPVCDGKCMVIMYN